ncbi:MAG: permease-like cell division protein FtsX [Firmicutes bacterium]|nr:permease-like cell division protein FtsX [Bacillota bacterium]MCM1402038.1 permease-like cell division protein FtsX [Bacteroides sp.]MCM1476785.1 permease-like cell division protein FtsX [Bacteroides sp.]
MKTKATHNKAFDGTRLITIVSVAMVLLIIGITIMLGLGARRAASLMRSEIGFVAVVNPAGGQTSVDSLNRFLATAPFVQKVTARTAARVLERWEQMMGPEEMLDVNPFLPEMEVQVKPAWARPDSLEAIVAEVEKMGCVDTVQTHTDVAAGLSHSLSTLMLVLTLVGATLLVISIVLIANTVKLQLHSHRFVIHTQQYVGATPSYIVRPYTTAGALSGLLAALLASALLSALVWYAVTVQPAMKAMVSWPQVGLTSLLLIAVGVILCALTARLAALKYVHRTYDEIFN